MSVFSYIAARCRLAVLKMFYVNCQYCNELSFFREGHKLCKEKYRSGRRLAVSKTAEAIINSGDFKKLVKEITEICELHFMSSKNHKDILIEGYEKAVEIFLGDGQLDEIEDEKLYAFIMHFLLSQDDLNKHGWHVKACKAGILREVQNGKVPSIKFGGEVPVIFMKNEKVVWSFENCEYWKDKAHRRYVRKSWLVSGHTVQDINRVYIDNGYVIITNKHIYFAGRREKFRLSYKKIVSFEKYSDGIGVIRDAITAKPQVFITGDGPFAHDLVASLARL